MIQIDRVSTLAHGMEARSGRNYLINFLLCIFNFMSYLVNLKSSAINSSCMDYLYSMCFKLQSVNSVQHLYFTYVMCALNCVIQLINFMYLN